MQAETRSFERRSFVGKLAVKDPMFLLQLLTFPLLPLVSIRQRNFPYFCNQSEGYLNTINKIIQGFEAYKNYVQHNRIQNLCHCSCRLVPISAYLVTIPQRLYCTLMCISEGLGGTREYNKIDKKKIQYIRGAIHI